METAMGVRVFNAGVPSCEIARAPFHRAPASTNGPAGDPIVNPPACSGWAARWRDQLAQTHPDHAILVLGFPAVEDLQINGVWRSPCSTVWNQFYRAELTDALRTLASSGSHVWITTAAPPTAFYFPKSLTAQTECLNRDLREAALLTQTSVLDVESYVCPKGHCQQYIDGFELRPDGFHYSGPGGRLVAGWLIRQVTQPPTAPATPQAPLSAARRR
jgi:hypothetical protein